MAKIRVLVVDDHGIVRAGIRSMLEAQSDLEVVGEAASGPEALRKAEQLLPDVVLMDLAMQGMSGIEAIKELRRRLPSVHVLALTIQDNEEYFFPVLRAGALGYVLKEAEPEELLAAIRTVHQGAAFLSPAVAKAVLGSYPEGLTLGRERDSYDTLTPREREVLQLVAEGRTNREIANTLYLSVKTVEKHRASMMAKLNLSNRSELVKYAIRKGLIELQG